MVVIKEKEYLTLTEFTNAINKSWTTTDNYVRKGIITPALIIGKHKYFLSEQLEKFKKGYCVPFKKEESD